MIAQRQGQATLLVMVGLVLLIIFSMVLYVTGRLRSSSLDAQVDEVLTEFSASSLQAFVNSCVELTAQEGLRIAALQGGAIYDSQGGKTERDVHGEGVQYLPIHEATETFDVFYGIKKSPIALGPPNYPTGGTSHTFATYAVPYFGQNALLKLCDKNGPNRVHPGNPGAFQTCLPGTYTVFNSQNSIQANVASYIEKNVPKCIGKQSTFEAAGGVRMTLEGTPNATVIWGSDSVTALLNYPTTISLSSGKSQSYSVEFNARLPIRFKYIYNLAYSLITEEISNINYKLSVAWTASPFTDSSITVFTIRDPVGQRCLAITPPLLNCKGMTDNYVIIQDEKSQLGGDPLKFQFAIANRPPDLETINQGNNFVVPFVATVNYIDPDDETGEVTVKPMPLINGKNSFNLGLGVHNFVKADCQNQNSDCVYLLNITDEGAKIAGRDVPDAFRLSDTQIIYLDVP